MEKMTIEKALKFAEFELWNAMLEIKHISTIREELEDAHSHVVSALKILTHFI